MTKINNDVLKCKYCTCKKREKNFGSDRQCGFNKDGLFNKNNWQCPLLLKFFKDNKEDNGGIWLGNDSYAVIKNIYDKKTKETYSLLLTRYKHRGTVSSVQRISYDGTYPANINDVNLKNKDIY